MGNRAMIKPVNDNKGIYLHWFGGIEHVRAFLEYCKLCGYAGFDSKSATAHGLARLAQVIGNYIGGSLSLGLTETDEKDLDDYAGYLDNGIYIVDDWSIIRTINGEDLEKSIDEDELISLIIEIDMEQPESKRLGADTIRSNFGNLDIAKQNGEFTRDKPNGAVIKPVNDNRGICLYGNNKLEDITAFLEYCKLHKYRDFGGEKMDSYGFARMMQVIGNYIGKQADIGLIDAETANQEKLAEEFDNGIYLIDGWDIREIIHGDELKPVNYEDLIPKLLEIDAAQPERLGEDYIKSRPVNKKDLKIGDEIWYYDPDSSSDKVPSKSKIVREQDGCFVLKNGWTAAEPLRR